jgi:hypothetical protein
MMEGTSPCRTHYISIRRGNILFESQRPYIKLQEFKLQIRYLYLMWREDYSSRTSQNNLPASLCNEETGILFNLALQSRLISLHFRSFLISVFSYPMDYFVERGGVAVTISTRIWECSVQILVERVANTRKEHWLGHGRVFKNNFPLILDLSTYHLIAYSSDTDNVVN